MQRDVNDGEEAELRRLEGGVQVDGDADGVEAAEQAPPVRAQAGTMVSGAVQRAEQLSSKLFANGGFRDSAKIVPLLPSGGAGLKAKVPKRKDYGAEGEAGDAAHASAMKEFGIKEFGASHVKGETMNTRMNYVGLFKISS